MPPSAAPAHITSSQIATLLDAAPASIEILSLDCFDTLIWRNTHTPRDVFAGFPAGGPTVLQRSHAEIVARKRSEARSAGREVTLDDIYRALMPEADDQAITEAIAAELALEAHHCFAFAPTVALMREAKHRGLQVIIVSDTYLTEAELRGLIGAVAGEDVLALIDTVFCSSHYGAPKDGGLFSFVLETLNQPAGKILHLGDNASADYHPALAAGLHAVHLIQFDEHQRQQLRLEATVGGMLESRGQDQFPILQPHRAALAMAPSAAEDAAATLGYATLGPILHGFAAWVREEVDALGRANAGKGKVRLAFLMRDGFLPKLAFEALVGDSDYATTAIEISRFTALAASMTSEERILHWVETNLSAGPAIMARQLLFPSQEIDRLKAVRTQDTAGFVREVRKPATLQRIIERSKAFASRMADYVKRETGAEPGDTLVFIDLGYNGTVQNLIQPMLVESLGVSIAGRYLLLSEKQITPFDKRGMIDRQNYDPRTLPAMVSYIAILEQLCTSPWGSVLDYNRDGVRRAAASVKGRQSVVRDAIQAACLRYVGACSQAIHKPAGSMDMESLRQAAAATLMRLIYLPTPRELEALTDFEHDVNLGTQQTVRMFDTDIAERSLKQAGLFYMNQSNRMYLPAEVRGHGLPLSLTVLAQGRFGLDLHYADFCDRKISLPIMASNGEKPTSHSLDAAPTHDGYFLATAAIGAGVYTIGFQFGRLYEWMEIRSIDFFAADEFLSPKFTKTPVATPASPVFDAMQQMGPGIFQCSKSALVLVPPPPVKDRPMVLAVVFRPLVPRASDLDETAAPRSAKAAA